MVMARSDFDSFCRREYPSVYAAARALTGDRETALDVTQEAFARAYARWARLGRASWAGGWVMTTALNLCRRSLRRRPPGVAPQEAPGRESKVDARLDLAAALRQLPARQREAVVLHYLVDLPVAGVAEIMKTSEGTVKSHLARGRHSLAARLGPVEKEGSR
jgi:RNA polymerase sigma-70 factor (ECF subfamily)